MALRTDVLPSRAESCKTMDSQHIHASDYLLFVEPSAGGRVGLGSFPDAAAVRRKIEDLVEQRPFGPCFECLVYHGSVRSRPERMSFAPGVGGTDWHLLLQDLVALRLSDDDAPE